MIAKKHIFFIIFACWAVIIMAFIGYKQYTLSSGTKILLKTAPVDPRDVLRGDYVVLSYEISRLDLSEINANSLQFSGGDTAFVILEKGEKYWAPSGISKDRPSADVIFIKGDVTSAYGTYLSMRYGIENYFVPEGKGSEIEQYIRRGSTLDVEVSVDEFGNSVISGLYANGTEIRLK